MFKIIFFIVILIFFSNCKRKESFDEVLNTDEKIVYLETHDKSSSRGAGYFMDVVILDLKTLKKYYITNDIFLDESPAISNNGKYISFFSAREGEPLILRIQGLGAPRKLYLFNSETKRFRKISDVDFMDSGWDNVYFYKDTTEFIFPITNITEVDSIKESVKTFNVKTRTEKLLKKIDDDLDFRKMIISTNKNIMVLGCYKIIVVWNVRTGEEFRIHIPEGAYIGGIDKTGDKFLYCTFKTHQLFEYNITKRSSSKIELPKKGLAFPVNWSDFYYTKDGNIIGIASDVYVPDDDGKREIVEYNVKTKKYKYITKDGLQKYSLIYWYR